MKYAKHARTQRKTREGTFSKTTLPLVLSTAYVLILPTLLAAMTGYQAEMIPVLPWNNNTFISFTDLTFCRWAAVPYGVGYKVTTGAPIELSGNHCIPDTGPLANAVHTCKSTSSVEPYRLCERSLFAYKPEDLTTLPGCSSVGQPFRVDGTNVCSGSGPFHYSGRTYFPIDMETDFLYSVFKYDDQLLLPRELRDTGICQAQETYRWGFSSVLTFIFLLLTIWMSVWLAIIWLRQSSSGEAGKLFGTFRTAVEVADRIRKEVGDGVDDMTDDEIAKAIT